MTERPEYGLAVVLAEIGYRLEVRHQAASQPHQLDGALALPLGLTKGPHHCPIETSEACRNKSIGGPVS